MASESEVEMFNIVVISRDGEKTNLFRLSSESTVSEVKRLWETEHNLPERSIIRRADGARLDDNLRVSDIEVAIPGCSTITVLIEEAIVLQVGLYKCLTDDMRTISVGLSSKPEDLHLQLRQLFGLGEDRFFRLRSRDTPLMYDRSFENQSLESGASIFVDLGFEFDVTNEWTSAVTKQLMYSSEDASHLLTNDDMPQRVMLNGVQIDVHHDIFNSLATCYNRMTQVIVRHQKMRDITLLVNDFMRQRLVWPTDMSGRVIQRCPCLKSEMYFENERLPKDASMKQLQLPDHAVVHTKTGVTVKLSDGKRKVLKVSDLATVKDVEAMVSSFEGSSQFVLTSGGRRLKSSEKIKAINDPSSIEVEQPGDTVIVHLSDRSVRLSTEQRKLRFSEVLRKVAENGRLKLKKLLRTPLQCQGCRRCICLEEEDFQTIPSKCCRVRSLILTDSTPPKVKERRMQTQPFSVEASSQTSARDVKEFAQQAEGIAATSIQHPPPARFALRAFRVLNYRMAGRTGEFNANLLLSDSPTAGQVREAVAAIMKVSPTKMGILRAMRHRKRDGERLFHVWNDRHGGWGFADVAGRLCSEESSNWAQPLQLDDIDPFPLIPGWRNAIRIQPR